MLQDSFRSLLRSRVDNTISCFHFSSDRELSVCVSTLEIPREYKVTWSPRSTRHPTDGRYDGRGE